MQSVFYDMRMSPEELSNNFFPMPILTRGHPVCTGPSAEISTSLPSCRFQANSEVH